MIDGQPPQPNHMEEEEEGWWEATPGDEPEPEIKPETTQATEAPETTNGFDVLPRIKVLTISSVGLFVGFTSHWSWWQRSGFEALRNSFSDVALVLTDGLSLYSEWGLTPLEYIEWLMFPLLPLVFVTTFVVTWYNSLQGDWEFGRKASIFHLSFFGVWYLLHILNWVSLTGQFELVFPDSYNYGLWIAAASGIGLHPTVYGLVELESLDEEEIANLSEALNAEDEAAWLDEMQFDDHLNQ
jgi:hypothetical protein